MDRYTKVEQKREEIAMNENEMRITSQGLVRNYITYATTLLLQILLLRQSQHCLSHNVLAKAAGPERRGKEIVLKAMGQAISKTVAIAEIIKRNIPRLHQDTHISSISITDVWEPIEEGLLPVEMTRQVSMISITLSTKELNKDSPGYQPPLYVDRSRPQYNSYQRQQQPRQAQQGYNAVNEEPYGGSYHGNRGRVQGGRGRGWNRGGYGNQGDGYRNYQGDGYRNYQGDGHRNYQGDGYRNYQGGGQRNYQDGGQRNYQGDGQRNYQGDGQRNYQGGSGYSNYQGGRGYGNYRGGRGYGNYQDGAEYGNYQGGRAYDNNGYSHHGRGVGRGGNAGYRGGGYMRGGSDRGGGGGRFNGRGMGRMGGRSRDGGDPQKQ